MITRLISTAVLALSLISFAGCDDSLSTDDYDDVDVNVYFYFPNDKEVFLGKTRGADSCGSMANSYASRHNLSRGDRWSYICCTIRKGSQCYEKIR
jgi:hypothetical protein